MENKNSILPFKKKIFHLLVVFQSRVNLSKIQEETDGRWETKVQAPDLYQEKKKKP